MTTMQQPMAGVVEDPKGPPFDPNAEAALLGSCLIDQTAYLDASAIIQPDDFYLHRHRILWDAIAAIYERGDAVDEITIESELRAQGTLNDVGGMPYVIQLLTTTPTSANAETYARLVQAGSLRRKTIDAASRLAQAAQRDDMDVRSIMNVAESIIGQIDAWRGSESGGTKSIADALADFYDSRVAIHDGTASPGIPTGLADLDSLIGGMPRGELIYVGGRPGMGKSDILINIAVNAAKLGQRVAFFSVEMSCEQVILRIIANEIGVETTNLRDAKLTDYQWRLFTEALGRLANLPLTIDDTAGLTPMAFRRKVNAIKRRDGLDLACVDYVQLMESGLPASTNRVQQVGHISAQLKLTAKTNEIAVLSAAQISREVDNRGDHRPVLSDLRESGNLEADAFMVWYPYREYQYDKLANPYAAELIVAKNRGGPLGTIPMNYWGKYSRFRDIQRQGAQS